jgi:hypothetical protein
VATEAFLEFTLACSAISEIGRPDHHWKPDMLVRPHDLADQMSVAQPTKTFTLPIDAARLKAREILNRFPQAGYMAVVENWRQLPDGQIEFTMRHLPAAD